MVFRTYVEKRQGLAPECEALLTDCRDFLGVQGLRAARIWNRYDVEGIEAPLFENACRSVFSEPPLDLVSDAADTQDACAVFAVEPLPGQFDQRADSAVAVHPASEPRRSARASARRRSTRSMGC